MSEELTELQIIGQVQNELNAIVRAWSAKHHPPEPWHSLYWHWLAVPYLFGFVVIFVGSLVCNYYKVHIHL